jgi:hypothetical protein
VIAERFGGELHDRTVGLEPCRGGSLVTTHRRGCCLMSYARRLPCRVYGGIFPSTAFGASRSQTETAS